VRAAVITALTARTRWRSRRSSLRPSRISWWSTWRTRGSCSPMSCRCPASTSCVPSCRSRLDGRCPGWFASTPAGSGPSMSPSRPAVISTSANPRGVAGRDPLQGGAIRRHYAPTGGTESLGTVAIAISTDLAMSVAKAVAAALTGSAGLFAETLHALADTGNQLLLLKGLRGSRRRPDTSHPFGYGAELFSWSLLAALSIVVVGGVLSIWEGSQRLLHPGGIQAGLVGVAVLGLGCLLDGTSWLASVRQLRREATARRGPVPPAPALDHRHRGHGRLLRGRSGAARQRDRPHRARLAPAPRLPGPRRRRRDHDRPAAGIHRPAASGTKPRPVDQPLGVPGGPGPHPRPAGRRPRGGRRRPGGKCLPGPAPSSWSPPRSNRWTPSPGCACGSSWASSAGA
jgi:hypothetical protein